MTSRLEDTTRQSAVGASLEQAETVQDFQTEKAVKEVPDEYWRSSRFIRSLFAIVLLANGLYIRYVMPVCKM